MSSSSYPKTSWRVTPEAAQSAQPTGPHPRSGRGMGVGEHFATPQVAGPEIQVLG